MIKAYENEQQATQKSHENLRENHSSSQGLGHVDTGISYNQLTFNQGLQMI